ncbi:MAG TPA: pyruvate phosphate dikinase [Candidatus Cloacimonetes bacterium]|nr:pyruvate phosphate dikinase [Candidatus Cloacimonadota bacterium]
MDGIESKALAVNLQATQVGEIELDEPAKWLLSLSKDFFGVNQRLRNFLDELYHPFVNIGVALKLMRTSILGDLWWFCSREEPAKVLSVLLHLYRKAENLAKTEEVRKGLFQDYMEFALTLCEQDGILICDSIVSFLQELIEENMQQFIRLSSTSRKLLIELAKRCEQPQRCLELLKTVLAENLRYWQESTDIGAWLEALQNPDEEMDTSSVPTPGFYDFWLQTIKEAEDVSQLKIVPAFTEIATLHRDFIREFKTLSHRIQYIIHLLGLPAMQNLIEHLLWDLNHQLASLYKELSVEEVHEMIDNVFDLLKKLSVTHIGIVLDCVLTISKSVLNGSHIILKRHILEKVIDLGFTPPGEIKISGDWQLDVDKNHVKHLRVLLELIAINPIQNKELLAFTVINIRKHGIFISDTDLFQKDVSAFLNANLKDIFVQSKQLLRQFPVFFSEIGAEGEIRDASTEMDELFFRNDRLIHFLRKQIHTESNNTQITLIEEILSYWVSQNPAPLKDMVPEDVWIFLQNENKDTIEQGRITREFLKESDLSESEFLALSWQRVEVLFRNLEENSYTKRLKLISYCHFLLKDKYNLDPYDIVRFLSRYTFFNTKEQLRLRSSLNRKDYDSSIRQMLGYIGRLNTLILDPRPSSAWENIYYKRHIAAGIPSMYGMYREAKLEAMGMVFRLENVIRRLFASNIRQLNLNYMNGKTLRRINRILELYEIALKQEMIISDSFSSSLAMLTSFQNITNLSLAQYIDVFNLLKDSVNEIINEYYYRFYDRQLGELSEYRNCEDDSCLRDKEIFAEEFYREMLAGSFLVQGLDGFIARILQSLNEMRVLFDKEDIVKVISYDPDKLFFHLYSRNSRIENQVLLGSKALFLKRLYQYEFPIPPGFVITTHLFSNRDIINAHPDISAEFYELLWKNLNKLERYTGLGFGDIDNPLLFSVRSGAPISLPGAMDTFLNIGLNDEITEKLSQRPNYGWTAWDCYRRLLQSWGMAYGISRDEFDGVMIDYKKRYDVTLKTQFTPQQMRLMVDSYKEVLARYNVTLEQDPRSQLVLAISHVLDSWDMERARLYREKLHIANEWGTAVIIQKMVLGNLSHDGGTGVLFTYADWSKEPGILLNGDFTLCSQGEDVVAGLVHTMPISEAERIHRGLDTSLEKDFPLVYRRLLLYARQLIQDKNYPHQEIEFTFEGSNESDLYILQTRNQIIHKSPEYKVLGKMDKPPVVLGSGIGIGKGVVNGIIVVNASDIEKYKALGEPLILVRPDTVPDDMALLFESQGLLTSRGGVTSHAAVTATRLGLIGIVNCRELVVDEEKSTLKIGQVHLKAGDKIALDSTGGLIYQGHYPLVSVQSLV